MGSLRPAFAALLVAVLLLVVPATATPIGAEEIASPPSAGATLATPVTPHPNTTAVLDVAGGPTSASTVTADIDVGATMAVDAGRIEGRFVRYQIDHRYAMAETAAERQAAVSNSTRQLESRTDALLARERTIRADLASGSRSPTAALGGFTAIGATAAELDAATTVLNAQVDTADGDVGRARVAGIRAELVPVHGPVRSRAGDAMAAGTEPTRVVVLTDGSGLVLATLDGDEYVRSAAVPSARNVSRVNQFATGPQPPLDAAEARARELYPWAFENHQGYSVGLLAGGPALRHAAVYPLTVNHPQGTARQGDLVAYLDGGTTDAFREVQYLSTAALPRDAGVVARTGPLALQVNTTRPGGPVLVNVTSDGRPVDAAIFANGDRLGTVGADGQRWVVAPPGPVNITAVDGGTTVSTTAHV